MMKVKFKFILLLTLLLESVFSNAKECQFNWKLEHEGSLRLCGTANSLSSADHRGSLNHHPEIDCSSQLCNACRVDDFIIYKVTSLTAIDFIQNDPGFIIPGPFSILLGDGINNFKYRFHYYYHLRGQTTTPARNLAWLFFCTCAFPCFLGYELCTNGRSHENERARITSLQTARPNRLPEHVTIAKRIFYHEIQDRDNAVLPKSRTEVTDSDVHIFDIFLMTDETQHWIIEHLNQPTALTLALIIPELLNKACSTQMLVQQQSSEDNSESLQPSHFITFTINNGIKLQYHLKQLSADTIRVLAIVVSFQDYTLTLTINDYNSNANEPPPHYMEVISQGHTVANDRRTSPLQ